MRHYYLRNRHIVVTLKRNNKMSNKIKKVQVNFDLEINNELFEKLVKVGKQEGFDYEDAGPNTIVSRLITNRGIDALYEVDNHPEFVVNTFDELKGDVSDVLNLLSRAGINFSNQK